MLNIFQTCLKGFKLKMMVVELKTAQWVELDEEPVDRFSSTGQRTQKPSFSSKMLSKLTSTGQGPVEVRSRGN